MTATATVVSFPAGNVISKRQVPRAKTLVRTADPNFVFIWRPAGAAAVELGSGAAITIAKGPLDVWGSIYIAQPEPGAVGLYERGEGLQVSVWLHPK